MTNMIQFGLCLPQDGFDYGDVKQVAQKSEGLGFHSFWVYDHIHSFPRPDQDSFLECWTLLSALAEATTTIRLGSLVLDVQYRNPALLAKMAASLDHVCNGRLDLGLGAGGTGRASAGAKAGFTPEFTAYGIDFPSKVGVRIARLRETVEILKKLWTGARTTHKGKFYHVQNAYCLPKPLQAPQPPIWIAGMGEQLTLRLVAEHADACNFAWDITPEECRAKLQVLQNHCHAVHRPYASIRKSLLTVLVMGRTLGDVEQKYSRMAERCHIMTWYTPVARRASAICGTPEECINKIRAFVDAGVDYFIFVFPPSEVEESMREFCQYILPSFSRVP